MKVLTARTKRTGPTKAHIMSDLMLSQQWLSALYLLSEIAKVKVTITTGKPERGEKNGKLFPLCFT